LRRSQTPGATPCALIARCQLSLPFLSFSYASFIFGFRRLFHYYFLLSFAADIFIIYFHYFRRFRLVARDADIDDIDFRHFDTPLAPPFRLSMPLIFIFSFFGFLRHISCFDISAIS
jgi:hypothetical protein